MVGVLISSVPAKSLQPCPAPCDPMDHIARQAPPLARILQAGILEWVATSSSRVSSRPRGGTYVSRGSCLAGRFFITEPPGKLRGVTEIHAGSRIWADSSSLSHRGSCEV